MLEEKLQLLEEKVSAILDEMKRLSEENAALHDETGVMHKKAEEADALRPVTVHVDERNRIRRVEPQVPRKLPEAVFV